MCLGSQVAIRSELTLAQSRSGLLIHFISFCRDVWSFRALKIQYLQASKSKQPLIELNYVTVVVVIVGSNGDKLCDIIPGALCQSATLFKESKSS